MHASQTIKPVIVLTRETWDNQALAIGLREKGLEVLEYPCIQTTLLPFSRGTHLPADNTLADFQVIVFTSKRGVAGMKPAVSTIRKLLRTGLRIAVVGPATARAVREAFGTSPHYTAEPATSDSLARLLVRSLPSKSNILHIRGDKTTGAFKSIIREHRFPLTECIVYRTESTNPPPLDPMDRAIILLASPSAVKTFFTANSLSSIIGHWTYLSIGPTTTKALGKTGASPVIEAKSTHIDSIIEAIENIIATNKTCKP